MSTSHIANTILHGDCIEVMSKLPSESVGFTLTDPPYAARYRPRDGQRVANDDSTAWLGPAFEQIFRLMRPDSFCISFYGWSKADAFTSAWRDAGFRPVGHIVFRKRYASSAHFLRCEHEQAYLLAKGRPRPPARPIPDVIDWRYTGNRHHPTEKAVEVLKPLIGAFSAPRDIVLDPFCGSGSTLLAAQELGRDFIGIELDRRHCETAFRRTFAVEDAA